MLLNGLGGETLIPVTSCMLYGQHLFAYKSGATKRQKSVRDWETSVTTRIMSFLDAYNWRFWGLANSVGRTVIEKTFGFAITRWDGLEQRGGGVIISTPILHRF